LLRWRRPTHDFSTASSSASPYSITVQVISSSDEITTHLNSCTVFVLSVLASRILDLRIKYGLQEGHPPLRSAKEARGGDELGLRMMITKISRLSHKTSGTVHISHSLTQTSRSYSCAPISRLPTGTRDRILDSEANYNLSRISANQHFGVCSGIRSL